MSEQAASAIIIGAGHAGGELAIALRNEGWSGRILLIGDEPHLPYHRPPLSKAYLSGSVEKSSLAIRPLTTYQRAEIEILSGFRVMQIDRERRIIELNDGQQLPYAKLAIATGGEPRPLSLAKQRYDNLHYLRRIEDVDAIRPQLLPGSRLVMIGGGYIGLEMAAVAISQGLQVTVIEAQERVLQRVTAPVLSRYYQDKHRAAGVEIRTNTQVNELINEGAQIKAVRLNNGQVLDCDLVVVGIGLIANTSLAEQAGLAVDSGIVVDERGQTSDADIYAVGDCSNHPSSHFGRRLRLESVPNAMEQARVAAANMAGKDKTYSSVPWFWSDQFELKLKMVGLAEGYERAVVRGDMASDSFSVFYLQGQRVLAADTINRPQDFIAAKRLIAEQIELSDQQLTDDSVALKALLPSP